MTVEQRLAFVLERLPRNSWRNAARPPLVALTLAVVLVGRVGRVVVPRCFTWNMSD